MRLPLSTKIEKTGVKKIMSEAKISSFEMLYRKVWCEKMSYSNRTNDFISIHRAPHFRIFYKHKEETF